MLARGAPAGEEPRIGMRPSSRRSKRERERGYGRCDATADDSEDEVTMNQLTRFFAILTAAVLLPLAGARGADTAANGTFRFLTTVMPAGSTNAEYVARILVANSDGPVTFSINAAKPLPAGVNLDAASGFLTGRPTATFHAQVGFQANDGAAQIESGIDIDISAAGGGGNEGSTFGNFPLAEGRVDVAYTHTVTVQNGVGPYVFGAADLPPGLRFDGATGTISGTPAAAGTFFVSISVTDHGEGENKVVTVAPLKILPATNDFAFTTSVLANGEVGTPYCDTWLTTGGQGGVTFSSSGLPAGLSVDAQTGAVSGTPTVAGTFEVVVGATDGHDTITTNLSMIVAPSSASTMHWDFFGVPTALIGVTYTRQPPIVVSTSGGTAVTYTSIGLPEGIAYNTTTGELTGTPTAVGEYPVTFVATEPGSGAVVTLSLDFLVLPPSGGDALGLAANFWIVKTKLDPDSTGNGTWKGSCIYNADRRAGRAFDPATQDLVLGLSASEFRVPAGSLQPVLGGLASHTDKDVVPAVTTALAPSKQTLKWSVTKATLTATLPSVMRESVLIGARGYRMDAFVDEPGKLVVPRDLRRSAFVVSRASLKVAEMGKDTVSIGFLLADPAFVYEAGVSTLRLRLLDGLAVLLDRDFTALGTAEVGEGAGSVVFKLKATEDDAAATRLTKFVFKGKKGTGTASFENVTLPALPDAEAHLGIELTVGSRIYFTAVTFFERKANLYSVP
jgi:hypothetical protein